MGKHQLKVGGQLSRVNFLMDIDASQKGRWGFPVDVFYNPADPNSHPDTFNAAIGTATHEEAKWNYALYVQDTWQVRDDLTLNLGLRYDVDNTITVGNELVDARNARYLANLGVAPLVKVDNDLNNVAPRLGFVWVPTDDRKLAIRGSAGLFFDQNHFNYNDVYVNQTLLADRRVNFNCNSTTDNPLYNAAEGLAPSRVRCRAFLAERFPLFPNVASLGLIPELAVALAPDFRVPYTRQAAIGFSQQLPARLLGAGRLRLFVRRRRGAAAQPQSRLRERPMGQQGPAVHGDQREREPRIHQIQRLADPHRLSRQQAADRPLVYALEGDIQQQRQRRRRRAPRPTRSTCRSTMDRPTRIAATTWCGTARLPFPLEFQLAGIYRYASALPYSVTSRFVINARPEPRNSRRGDDEKNFDLRVGKQFKLPRQQLRESLLGDVQRLQHGQFPGLPGLAGVLDVRPAGARAAQAPPAVRFPRRFLTLRHPVTRHPRILALAIAALAAVALQAQDTLDYALLARVQDEGLSRSQVMDHVGWLSDVNGPRLTGSPGFKQAADWAVKRLGEWGLANAKTEKWKFGKGWSLSHFQAHLLEPQRQPLIGYPKAWSPSTKGLVTGDVIRVAIGSEADFEKYRGKLGGKIVLAQPARDVRMLEGRITWRMGDEMLAEAERLPIPAAVAPRAPAPPGPSLAEKTLQFFLAEGVAAVLDRGSDQSVVAMGGNENLSPMTQRVDGGTIFVQAGGPRDENAGKVPPQVTLAVEHYNRLVRVLDRGLPVKMELEIRRRVPRRDRHERYERRRRAARIRPGQRNRAARRASRQLALVGGRHGQRRRSRRHDGGDAHPQDGRRQTAADHPDRTVGR